LLIEFPSWFASFSKYIVKDHHKWVTYFGLELNLFQKILIATSFDKFKSKNIQVISHGYIGGGINSNLIHILSLFPELKINSNILNSVIKNKSIHNLSQKEKGILFCPFQIPWISEFLSLESLKSLTKVYFKTIQILSDGVKLGKNIKIRYKDNDYLKGYMGQLSSEESRIPVEEDNFEKVYQNYSTIITIPCGTIFTQCQKFNISCIAYNHSVVPTDRKMYNEINKLPNVCNNLEIYLKEL